MKTILYTALLTLGLGLGTMSAHHSLAAEFDTNKPVHLEGVLTNIDWRNPHAWIYMTVTKADGTAEKWQCELGSPNAMTRAGFTQKSAKVGDQIMLDGSMAKKDAHTCSTRVVKAKDGRTLFSQTAAPVQ